MFYVYYRHLSSGSEEFCGCYATAKEAVHRIAFLYANDKAFHQEDEYYYFMKRH